MNRLVGLYKTTVGKKVVMAGSGVVLVGFVISHMASNLKAFQGAEKINAYSEFLRHVGAPVFSRGELLWVARVGLLSAVIIHIVTATQLTRIARRARQDRYAKSVHLEDSYASRTMRWGGVILLLFIVYHLLHLTVGTVHSNFQPGNAYANLVSGFQAPVVSLVYMVAVCALGLHLYHGIWSGLQTLGMYQPGNSPWRRAIAGILALVTTLGFLSVPVGVLAGIIR